MHQETGSDETSSDCQDTGADGDLGALDEFEGLDFGPEPQPECLAGRPTCRADIRAYRCRSCRWSGDWLECLGEQCPACQSAVEELGEEPDTVPHNPDAYKQYLIDPWEPTMEDYGDCNAEQL